MVPHGRSIGFMVPAHLLTSAAGMYDKTAGGCDNML